MTGGSSRESKDVIASYSIGLVPVIPPAEVPLEEGSSGLFTRVDVPRGEGKVGRDELVSLRSLSSDTNIRYQPKATCSLHSHLDSASSLDRHIHFPSIYLLSTTPRPRSTSSRCTSYIRLMKQVNPNHSLPPHHFQSQTDLSIKVVAALALAGRRTGVEGRYGRDEGNAG